MKLSTKRPAVKGELRERIAEELLTYVRRNKGHRIPAVYLADKYAVHASQISQVVKYLVGSDRLERVSRYVYAPAKKADVHFPVTNSSTTTFATSQVTTVPLALAPTDLAQKVEKLAKDFVWTTGSDSLKQFVESLQEVKQ